MFLALVNLKPRGISKSSNDVYYFSIQLSIVIISGVRHRIMYIVWLVAR